MKTTDCRYVFMGSPAFAAEVLDSAAKALGQPLLVISQPDRPVGRKAVLTASELKQYAVKHKIPVMTPERLSDDLVIGRLQAIKPDLIITAAYGQLVPLAVLALPAFGCLNVHTSLLPRHRGASPVQAAILAGDRKTGVTIMQMDQGLDTGPILAQADVPIAPDDTAGSLTATLAEVAGPLLVKTVHGVLAGRLRERAQNEADATWTHVLTKRDGALDFTRPAAELERRVRAMQPWPRAYVRLEGRELKVERAAVWPGAVPAAAPGTIVGLAGAIDIACGDGALRLLEIVPAGGKRMEASAMAHNLRLGQRFEPVPAGDT